VGRDSSVGIATGYVVDGPGIESRRGGEIFRTRPDPPCCPPNLLYNGYRVFPVVTKRPGRGVDHPPPSSAVVKERLELCVFFPPPPRAFEACFRVNFNLPWWDSLQLPITC